MVSQTPGADASILKSVSDRYLETIEGYHSYQDHLHARGELSGYELQVYLRRRRQTLLWKLLLDDAVESFAPFDAADPVSGLVVAVAEYAGIEPAQAAEEMQRALELGALVAKPGPDGVRYAWTE